MNSESSFEIEDEERAHIGRLAAGLSRTPPRLVDAANWIASCRRASCDLPPRVQARLREFRHDSGTDGMLLLRGLPAGTDVPPTPVEADSVELRATVSASVISVISMELGEMVAFRREKGGALVQNVVPVPGREAQQSNAGSTPLQLHVENAFHARRPDFVALMCVRSDHEESAGLQIASVRRVAAGLEARVRDLLGKPLYITEPPPSFGPPDSATKPHPVLDGNQDDPDVRVDFHATRPLDEDAQWAMTALRRSLADVTEEIRLSPADLALVDNRVALHGRTSFTPRYDGGDRWLHRTFIHLDHRRSRPLRSRQGHVLD